jgi:glycosyltransferase involved in cell wall biosynthesis
MATFVEATERPTAGLLEVIPNGVMLSPCNGGRMVRDGGPLRLGTLGNVKPIKGTDLLVRAFEKFDPRAPVELSIAGAVDSAWAQDLRRAASRDPRIEFVGRVSNPQAFLESLDVFVLPSRSEGMSNALLEAMALGLPCIATDVGSNRSLLSGPSRCPGGLVCPPTSDALFDSMRHLTEDADARRRYGEGAIQIAREQYTVEGMVKKYDLLYRTLARIDWSGQQATATSA